MRKAGWLLAWAAAWLACGRDEPPDVSNWTWFREPMVGGVSLTALDGSGPRDVWAVGAGGTLLHWDGRDWRRYQAGLTTLDLHAVATLTGNTAWAVGEDGIILRFHNGQWYNTYYATGVDLWGVDVADDGSAFAVGDAGTIYHYDGTDWKNVSPAGLTDDLRAVAMAGGGTAWAVGDNGAILYYDGATWRRDASPTRERLNAVTVTAAGAHAAGDNGVILYHDNGTWRLMPNNHTRELNGLAWAGDRAFAVGNDGTLLAHKDGAWGRVPFEFPPLFTNDLNDVWLANEIEGWAVGDEGMMLWYRRPSR